jgi:hypothetical protein
MNEPDITKTLEKNELDATQVGEVAGAGLNLCSADDLTAITASLIQSYENLVGFASHVIGRVAGEGNP